MKKSISFIIAISLLFTLSCKKESAVVLTDSGLNPILFQSINSDGKKSDLFVLKNKNGMEICVTNIGMRIVSLMVPDKNGEKKDIVLGFDRLEQYENSDNYFGAVTGRYTNRIANAKFVLDRVSYELRKKFDDPNSLHGGPNGFHTQYFTITQENETEIKGNYFSKNKEEGFPGDLSITVTYKLADDNTLSIHYEAETNMPTVFNPSNHSYFNLSGDLSQSVLDHQIYINASTYTPLNENMIPTGEFKDIKDTCFDFTQAKTLESGIAECGNYDLNYVLGSEGDISVLAAKAFSPTSGITMEVYTTEPGIQLYTPEDLQVTGKKGIVYKGNNSFCLETQHYPDSPNQPNFPTTVLRPGEPFSTTTIYKFSTNK
ncbi:galactose mutarotase [Bacteroidales bacterium OttesenSCG-928-M11]|nr:galactose mutarotase [Bacteroidales bacterium OttesenSCG-928-M11]